MIDTSALWYGGGSPAPITYTHFPKTFTQKKKKKKGRGCFNRPRFANEVKPSSEVRRSRSHLFGILWNIRLEHILTVRSRCSTERSQSQERDDHGHGHGCPRGPRTQEGERTAPPTELQQKKHLPLLGSPLFLGFLKGGGAGLCRNC